MKSSDSTEQELLLLRKIKSYVQKLENFQLVTLKEISDATSEFILSQNHEFRYLENEQCIFNAPSYPTTINAETDQMRKEHEQYYMELAGE